jgi:hypothetical protein
MIIKLRFNFANTDDAYNNFAKKMFCDFFSVVEIKHETEQEIIIFIHLLITHVEISHSGKKGSKNGNLSLPNVMHPAQIVSFFGGKYEKNDFFSFFIAV